VVYVHVVPLANAWRSGGNDWDESRRETYANDPGVLLSVGDAANQTKGDKGPEAWLPPNVHYRCEYARRWISIKHRWNLTKRARKSYASRDATGMWDVVSGAGQNPSAELISPFTSTTGGVMTVEAGAITGELELLTHPIDSGIEAQVQYVGARDLYTVTVSPVSATETHQKVHEAILKRLTTPGRVEQGNELPVDLTTHNVGAVREPPCF
jgi:hypothetical protein